MSDEVIDLPHGFKRYQSHLYRCRCQVCTVGNNEAWVRHRDARAAKLRADPTLRPHGLVNTYHNWGCRCDPCRYAYNSDRARKKGGIVTVPARRGPDVLDARYDRKPRVRSEPFGREWLADAV